jgi:hypothetical protein
MSIPEPLYMPPEAKATAKDIRAARYDLARAPKGADPFEFLLNQHAARVMKRVRKPRQLRFLSNAQFDTWVRVFWTHSFGEQMHTPGSLPKVNSAIRAVVEEVLQYYGQTSYNLPPPTTQG